MSHVYTARPGSQASPAAAVALDFGLRVRADGHVDQRTLFCGAENLSLQELCSELSLMISELRVRSFVLRHELEQLTSALLVNVRCGFWPLARRAAMDLGDLLAYVAAASPGGCGAVRPWLPLRLPYRAAVRAGGAVMAAESAVPVAVPSACADAPSPAAVEAASAATPILDAEKLVVYDVALELQVVCCTLVPVNHRVLQDQLERASLSVVCCIAEGAGRRSKKDKRQMYAMARGSAAETAAIVDVLRLRHLGPKGQCRAARSLALRVVQLLTKLDAALA